MKNTWFTLFAKKDVRTTKVMEAIIICMENIYKVLSLSSSYFYFYYFVNY